MVAFVIGCRKPQISTVLVISLLAINGLRKQSSYHVRAGSMKAVFSLK